MPKVIDRSKSNKRVALGRGLGSLLGEPQDDMEVELEEMELRPLTQSKSEIQKDKKNKNLPKTKEVKKAHKPKSNEADSDLKVWNIPIEKIKPNKKQPRKLFDEGLIKELASSIKVHGIIQPILARKMESGAFEIISGERRWRAAQKAGLHKVPVMLKGVSQQVSMELALIENIQRADLNPIEEAEALKLLMDNYNLTQKALADKLGKERVTIANSLRLLGLTPKVRAYAAEGQLKMGQAKVLLGITDSAQQEELAKIVIKKQLTVRAVERLISEFKKSLKGTEVKVDTLDVSKQLISGLIEELQKVVGSKVGIDYSKGRGKITIHYYSDEELNSYVEKIRNSWKQTN